MGLRYGWHDSIKPKQLYDAGLSGGCPSKPWRRRTKPCVIMYHVYMLRSLADSSQYYVGFTEDVEQRLVDHNAGHCTHTNKHRPWQLVAAISFANCEKALAFERYLKSGSGRAFAARHFR